MKIAIMQPYFMPYIGYWQLMSAVDLFVYLDDVNYIKKGWINRNRILVNKKEHKFTLYLQKLSQNSLIKDLKVGENRPKLLKTLCHSYQKSPYYKERIELVKKIFSSTQENLVDYICESNSLICSLLCIRTKIVRASSLGYNRITKKEDKILELCKTLRASTYINPIGGKSLYSRKDFEMAGICLEFLKPHLRPYNQSIPDFIPGLSILDILLFNSDEAARCMLSEYQLLEPS